MGLFSKLFGSGKKDKEQEQFWHCPNCGEEYRLELGHCLSCQTALVSDGVKKALLREQEEKLAARGTTIGVNDELQTLEKGPMAEIKEHAALLKKHHIPSKLVGEDPALGKCCGGPQLFLKLRPCDLEQAALLIHQEFEKSTALHSHDLLGMDRVIDTNAASNSCPACGGFVAGNSSSCPECGLCFSS